MLHAIGLMPLLLVAGCLGGSLANDALDGGRAADLTVGVAGCTVVNRTCADVIATFSSGARDVLVSCDEAGGTFTLRSTGVPNYTSNQTTPNAIGDQMWEVEFPLRPACADATTEVLRSRGPIGFMVNGVPMYGPEDAQGNDAVKNEGPSFDDCDGHADEMCSYHYHEEPLCVFGKGITARQHTLADGHSPVIGYALDGFAIYASPAVAGLDGCNGHSDAARGYHYHATPALPYLLGCYRGKVTGTMRHTPSCLGAPDGGTMMPPPDGGMMPPPDGMMPPRPDGGGGPCGQGMACPQGQVCCPMGLVCANNCVPDCRATNMCPMNLRCDQTSGVCRP